MGFGHDGAGMMGPGRRGRDQGDLSKRGADESALALWVVLGYSPAWCAAGGVVG